MNGEMNERTGDLPLPFIYFSHTKNKMNGDCLVLRIKFKVGPVKFFFSNVICSISFVHMWHSFVRSVIDPFIVNDEIKFNFTWTSTSLSGIFCHFDAGSPKFRWLWRKISRFVGTAISNVTFHPLHPQKTKNPAF